MSKHTTKNAQRAAMKAIKKRETKAWRAMKYEYHARLQAIEKAKEYDSQEA